MQEKTDAELLEYSRKIQDILEPCNLVEKLKILEVMHDSLIDVIKQWGLIIEEKHE